MKKIIIASTMIFMMAVMGGTALSQDVLLQAFASSDMLVQILRAFIIGFLAVLLLTSPPRGVYVRTSLGVISAISGVVVATLLFNSQLAVLDAVLLIQVAIIFALEALETPAPSKHGARTIPVRYAPQS